MRRARSPVARDCADPRLLLREADHRVLNSLQLAASILRQQAECHRGDACVTVPHADACDRIHAIAALHPQLAQGDEPGMVEMRSYLQALCQHLRQEWVLGLVPRAAGPVARAGPVDATRAIWQ